MPTVRLQPGDVVQVHHGHKTPRGTFIAFYEHPSYGLCADVAVEGDPPETYQRFFADRVRRADAPQRAPGKKRGRKPRPRPEDEETPLE